MSADSFIVYCGLRFDISPGDIEKVETQKDERIIKAKKYRLKYHYGRFEGDQQGYLLFIGYPLGIFGVENASRATFSLSEMQEIFSKTQSRLLEAGFEGDLAFHFEMEPDI